MRFLCLIWNNFIQGQLNPVTLHCSTLTNARIAHPRLGSACREWQMSQIVQFWEGKCRKSSIFQLKYAENHAFITIGYYRYYRKNQLLSLLLSLSVKKSLSVIPEPVLEWIYVEKWTGLAHYSHMPPVGNRVKKWPCLILNVNNMEYSNIMEINSISLK